MNHAGRIACLAAGLELPLLVTKPANVRYLSGLVDASNAAVLVDPAAGRGQGTHDHVERPVRRRGERWRCGRAGEDGEIDRVGAHRAALANAAVCR